ncbi:MAG: MBL fold metallo-hydrolase [Gammaproteobacteria bacterium]
MRRFFAFALAVTGAATASAQNHQSLDIYVVDVEGGNATLFVAPSGESLLIDTGNGGAVATRDADRIMAALKDAGVQQIDHLITTHYHGDHFGAMETIAGRMPIREFLDHGANVQPNPAADTFVTTTYPKLYAQGSHVVVKPGDRIKLGEADVRIVASAGKVLERALPGAGEANPLCASYAAKEADPSENAQSVGSHITFGRFRVVHMGDLTWNKEHDLMCPINRLGTVDLFIVSHHGQPISNAPILVHALHPRVAVLNNGTRKGGQPDTMKVLFASPGLEDLWQLHFSQLSGQEYTVPGAFIANTVDQQPASMPIAAIEPPAPGAGASPPPAHDGAAYWIKISALRDGTFTVTNARNGFAKTYIKR